MGVNTPDSSICISWISSMLPLLAEIVIANVVPFAAVKTLTPAGSPSLSYPAMELFAEATPTMVPLSCTRISWTPLSEPSSAATMA